MKKKLFFIKVAGDKIYFVPQDIIYAKTDKGYVEVWFKGFQARKIIRVSMVSFLQFMKNYAFICQVHKSYFVNTNEVFVWHTKQKELEMFTGAMVPISETYQAAFEQQINATEIK